ncbi:hypothetical protein CDD82_6479 [Ophiocordyceps australis]|uniref:Xylanolytic transcriptional activator regulatory domain-containing protein n=1 Tax=Ophiocordyceps australis TaxID=1399860 RepID=A0A2C5YV41_9HYPO|nr:hypothetical protein CDD82_6479 [Ophiocordyceps australis]
MALRSQVKDLKARLAASELESAARKRAHAEGTSPSDGGWAANGQAHATAESTADVIATGLFDHTPVRDIGYFVIWRLEQTHPLTRSKQGSSSNHAFFWSLTTSIDNVRQRSHVPYQPRGTSPQGDAPPTALSTTPLRASRGPPNQHAIARLAAATEAGHETDDSFPLPEKARSWTTRFFDTVGTVLPHVGQPEMWRIVARVIDGGLAWSAVDRAAQALLSIMFAQVLHTLDERSPEPFYRRALALLDEKALHIPTIDCLQALLLLASFQQNTQRSMESWAPHYLAVRIAYQLGIHAPASYEYLGPRDRELRSQLWFALVNQDRILTAGLARPPLIPEQHVRMELMEFMAPLRQDNDEVLKMDYFRQAILVHQILGLTVDCMYSSNINSSSRLSLSQIVSKTVDLTGRLEQWTADVPRPLVVFSTASAANLDSTPPDTSLPQRLSLLLTIFHIRAKMLIHGSLLMRLLERVTGSGEEASTGVLQDAGLSLLSNYLGLLRQWLQLING